MTCTDDIFGKRNAAAYDRHLTVDFAHPEAELSGYPLVVVPALYLMTDVAAVNLCKYVKNGGVLIVSYFSGIVDERDVVHAGAYPGALRDLLGVLVDEFTPLRAGEHVSLDNGMTGDAWSEIITLHGAKPILSYVDGPAAGQPAVTRHAMGRGSAWYVSTRLGLDGLDAVLCQAVSDTVLSPRDLPRDVEVVERLGTDDRYLFIINHTDADASAPIAEQAMELLTGESVAGQIKVPAGGVRVVVQPLR